MLRDSTWYEALSLTNDQAANILGEDATEYAAGHGSQLARRVAGLALSSADVDVLKPVCVAFKALFDAVKGVTANREALVDLIDHSILVVKTVQPGIKPAQLSPGVRYALDSFIDQVYQVVDFAGKFGGQANPPGRLKRLRRRILRLIHHADDAAIIEQHAAKIKNIVDALTAGAAVQSAQDATSIIEDVSKLKDTTVDGLRSIDGTLQTLRPRPVPASASVPITAMRLPPTFVERPSITAEVVAKLTGGGYTIHALVGIGGCGKSSLASSIVACPDVLRHFRDGVFWVSVGHGGKHQLHALLQALAREVGAAPGDWQGGMPAQFNDLDDVIGHLASFAKGRSCLLVLDNVWEAEVVRAAHRTGLSLLVTTRQQATVDDVGGTTTFVGDMTTEEAAAVLLALSGAVGRPSRETLDAIGQVEPCCDVNFEASCVQASRYVQLRR